METKINKLQTRMCNLQARMYILKIDMSDHVYSRSYCSLRKQSSAQSSWDCTHLHRPLQPFSGLQAHLMRYLTAAAASGRSIQWGISLLFFFIFISVTCFFDLAWPYLLSRVKTPSYLLPCGYMVWRR